MKYYIVNEYDRPDGERIAEKRENGKFYYMHPSLRNVKQFHGMTPTNPTPIEDFGIVWSVVDGVFHGKLTNPSIATYKDGKPRRWQGWEEFSFKL